MHRPPIPLPKDDPVRLASQGDREALRQVIASHGPVIWTLCRRLARDPEDAYQDVWSKVIEALPGFDPDGSATFGTWVRAVTHRHLVDLHRRGKVRGQVLPVGEIPDESPPVDDRLARSQRHTRLDRALEALPDDARRVVLMHHLGGVPLEDVARSEGVAVGTVKSRLHRARARLLALLGGEP